MLPPIRPISSNSGAERQLIVVLVHGTWGRKTPFAFPESRFCRSLRASLGREITFLRFEWSGKNTHRARLAAAEELRQVLERLTRDQPGARLCLVGHSHGGNVIAYALRDPALAARISLVFTIATPFVRAVPRRWAPWGNDSLQDQIGFSLIGPAFMFAFFVFPALLIGYLVLGRNLDGPTALLCASFPVAALFGLVMASGYNPKLVPWNERLSELIVGAARHLDIGSGLDNRLVTVRPHADEAYWWIQSLVAAADLPWRLMSYSLVFLGVFLPYYLLPGSPSDLMFYEIGFLVLVGLFASYLSIPFIAVTIGFAQLATRGSLAFGDESLFESIFVRTRAQVAPADCRTVGDHVIHIPFSSVLRHSQVIEHQSTVDIVVKGLKALA